MTKINFVNIPFTYINAYLRRYQCNNYVYKNTFQNLVLFEVGMLKADIAFQSATTLKIDKTGVPFLR